MSELLPTECHEWNEQISWLTENMHNTESFLQTEAYRILDKMTPAFGHGEISVNWRALFTSLEQWEDIDNVWAWSGDTLDTSIDGYGSPDYWSSTLWSRLSVEERGNIINTYSKNSWDISLLLNMANNYYQQKLERVENTKAQLWECKS